MKKMIVGGLMLTAAGLVLGAGIAKANDPGQRLVLA
jgi:hypothetical protein